MLSCPIESLSNIPHKPALINILITIHSVFFPFVVCCAKPANFGYQFGVTFLHICLAKIIVLNMQRQLMSFHSSRKTPYSKRLRAFFALLTGTLLPTSSGSLTRLYWHLTPALTYKAWVFLKYQLFGISIQICFRPSLSKSMSPARFLFLFYLIPNYTCSDTFLIVIVHTLLHFGQITPV